MSAVAVQLEATDALWQSDPENARNTLHRSLDATRHGLTEAYKSIQALRAIPLETLGLVNAIREYAEMTAKRTGTRLDLDLPATIDVFSEDVAQCFYRIEL